MRRVIGLAFVCLVTGHTHATTVFAAASLKNVLEEIAVHYFEDYQEKPTFSFLEKLAQP